MAIIDGHIRCCSCKVTMLISAFPRSVIERGNGRCRACAAHASRDRRSREPERVNANFRRWYTNNREVHLARVEACHRRDPDRRFDRHLFRRYGITLSEYNARLQQQGGGCAICGKRQGVEKLRLAVDHDHGTGRVRGILCHHCNKAIGALGDSAEGLRRVIAYLESSELTSAASAPTMRINLIGGAN